MIINRFLQKTLRVSYGSRDTEKHRDHTNIANTSVYGIYVLDFLACGIIRRSIIEHATRKYDSTLTFKMFDEGTDIQHNSG